MTTRRNFTKSVPAVGAAFAVGLDGTGEKKTVQWNHKKQDFDRTN